MFMTRLHIGGEIRASAERAARALDHDAADVVALVRPTDFLDQAWAHLGGVSIELVRAVQYDRHDPLVERGQDRVLLDHDHGLSCGRARLAGFAGPMAGASPLG